LSAAVAAASEKLPKSGDYGLPGRPIPWSE
jgi:hypothetical protein